MISFAVHVLRISAQTHFTGESFPLSSEPAHTETPDSLERIRSQVERNGFVIVPNVVEPDVVDRFRKLTDLARSEENLQNVTNSSGTYGLRNLTEIIPETADLVQHPQLSRIVEAVVGTGAFMTRSTLFDKTPGANWGVFWHQDLTIAVEEKCDMEGFGSWTRKAGVPCVQPPILVMKQILAVRLHLDDCGMDNGPLKVLPGTHQLDRVSSTDAELHQQRTQEFVCEVPAGGVLLMRPLLLHSSSPMKRASSRRVLHLEFSRDALPHPLKWKYQLPSVVPACD